MKAKENNIAHFNCLLCSQPDLSATDIDKDDYLTLFAALLKEHISSEDYQLFQKKATEFSLLKDPNFRWCAHVSIHACAVHSLLACYKKLNGEFLAAWLCQVAKMLTRTCVTYVCT